MSKFSIIAAMLILMACITNATPLHHYWPSYKFVNSVEWKSERKGAFLFLTVDSIPKKPSKKVAPPPGLERMIGNQGARQLPPPKPPRPQASPNLPNTNQPAARPQYAPGPVPGQSAQSAPQPQSALPGQNRTVPNAQYDQVSDPLGGRSSQGVPQPQSALPGQNRTVPNAQYDRVSDPLGGRSSQGSQQPQITISSPTNFRNNPPGVINEAKHAAEVKRAIADTRQEHLRKLAVQTQERTRIHDEEKTRQNNNRQIINENIKTMMTPPSAEGGTAAMKAKSELNKDLSKQNDVLLKNNKASEKRLQALQKASAKDAKPLVKEFNKAMKPLSKENKKVEDKIKKTEKRARKGKKG